MYKFKIRDAESYKERLQRFLSDRCLLFNPYSVPDDQLMEAAGRMKWRGAFSLTQMAIIRFTRIETDTNAGKIIERVFYTIGNSDEEICERMEAFTFRHTAADSLQQVRHTVNGQRITQPRQMERLVGKRLFVSRNIITVISFGYGKAMSMHRLSGHVAKDASIVRKAMIDAKLEMLGRLLTYPESQFYLDGTPPEPIDIKTPINAVMKHIQSYRPKDELIPQY